MSIRWGILIAIICCYATSVMAATTYQVTSHDEVVAALAIAVAGDTIEFADGTYNDSNLYIYVDGESDATPVAYSSGIYNNSAVFRVGRNSLPGTALPYDGLVYEVIVFNRHITEAEALEIHTNGINGGKGAY